TSAGARFTLSLTPMALLGYLRHHVVWVFIPAENGYELIPAFRLKFVLMGHAYRGAVVGQLHLPAVHGFPPDITAQLRADETTGSLVRQRRRDADAARCRIEPEVVSDLRAEVFDVSGELDFDVLVQCSFLFEEDVCDGNHGVLFNWS